MTIILSRRLIYPDGTLDNYVECLNPYDGKWQMFGFEQFVKFASQHQMECIKSLIGRMDGDIGYAYDVYSLPLDAYNFAKYIIS